jgi:hypothetical protein
MLFNDAVQNILVLELLGAMSTGEVFHFEGDETCAGTPSAGLGLLYEHAMWDAVSNAENILN